MSVQHQPKMIPLNKLALWNGNVRKTGGDTAIEELAASIEAHGLLNPLTIGGQFRKKHDVIAGGRRLRALQMLAKVGKLAKDTPIPCTMVTATDYTEASLAENVARVAMHPADQFEAWRALIEDGADICQIAARFGVAESTVKKRLALARVSPVIFAAYRDEEIGLEALQAFTVNDDHALQESVWAGLEDWQRDDARAIRRKLTETDVPSSDRRVQFVGLDAYEAAGGAVKRDLFAADGGGFCQDAALLDRLTMEKLQAVADEAKAEGWSWTEARLSFPWDERSAFAEAEAEEGEDGEALWSDEVKAIAGAVIYLGYDGVVIECGLIRADDEPEADADDAEDAAGDAAEQTDEAKAPALSAALIEDLTAHRTAALRIELARRPDVALAATVHVMALSAFYRGGTCGLKGGLFIRSLERSMQGYEEAPAVRALEVEVERIRDRLPGNAGDLWDWCLSADQDTLLDVLAVAAAYGVDAVVTKADQNRSGVAFGAALANAVKLDMAAWYRPTAGGYFNRIPKALILSDLEAAKGVPPAPAWEKMKKAELAALAERETAATDWLPEPLR